MTILEDDVNLESGYYKRKYEDAEEEEEEEHRYPAKKLFLRGNMLNGYRANEHRCIGETINDCPVATLSNTGNTCYLNSVLYTLRFAPTFLHNLHHLVDDLLKLNSRVSQTKAKSSSLGRNVGPISGPSSRSTSSKDLLSLGGLNDIPKSKVQIVTEKLHELFMILHNLEEARKKDSNDTCQPVAFLQAVREANYIFEGNQQQDAHELLVYLLDNIRETCDLLTQQAQHFPELIVDTEVSSNSKLWNVRKSWKKTKKKDKIVISEEECIDHCVTDTEDSNSYDVLGPERKKFYNFVAEDFEGITLRRTTCLECECVTERKEPFYDIPVPINFTEDDYDVDPSVIYRDACVTSEKLCDTNKYICDNCLRHNEASREVTFEKLPNIMVLQLKRFTTTAAGVQKVNTYMPTPLRMACFCESCCKKGENSLHHYELCCVIMHLGAAMASGHYIAYVKASDQSEYSDCSRDLPKTTLSASTSEKSLNFFKYFKSKPSSSNNSVIEHKNGVASKSLLPVCKSMSCCGVKMNKNVVENAINYSRRNGQDPWRAREDMWLECDDESVRPITSQELQDFLAYKPGGTTSTPYLLFYSKITESSDD
ncbi:PREDICTED: ubiquitin carboxyl-terminal hydrolase 1 [Nicrophorus vespilloides]|uniref:Ubiquitin carboxyl-terminal hydrolase 1 n=1 Tax=Nicrophorus vespilloides TaxID=110193 RepID=A0ABM1N9G6_NICVS|nr:PREDICTED: ubiquitin carboxyl-terminal hydrolase 1 [Nicrophorus vespilloides]XP_017783466.1 PREDICTED: ubiquitin carboxyl-terminal hydrolase 1 [Nicrophorus vespilloides]